MSRKIDRYLDGRTGTGLLLSGPGALTEGKRAAAGLLKESEESLGSHPDFLFLSSSEGKLGVDEASEIISKAQLKPAVAEHIVVLIDGMDAFNAAAQNKLLKLIEEGGAVVVIGITYGGTILPTIRSRMQEVRLEPMSLTEYSRYCREQGLSGDTEARFFISGGTDSPVDEELLKIFSEAGKCLKEADDKGLLRALHLVKEKDALSFFTVYRDFVPALLSYLGHLSVSDEVKKELITGRRASSATYTKDDFFALMTRVIEVGKGGAT